MSGTHHHHPATSNITTAFNQTKHFTSPLSFSTFSPLLPSTTATTGAVMTSISQSFQKRSFIPTMPTNNSLPVSQTDSQNQTLRRRLSTLSLKIQPISSSPASSWILRRSKSVSSIGEYAGSSVRKWWNWGWGLIFSRKPNFAHDLEESITLGYHNSKGSWRNAVNKVRSEIRKLVISDNVGLPQTYKYDSFNYSKNFDDGDKI